MYTKSLKWIIGFLIFFSMTIPAQAAPWFVSLSLEPALQDVNLGSQFTLDMVLTNPDPAQLVALNVWLSFDPAYLEVIDTDEGNWITAGVNVWDGPYHDVFDWDFHGHNIADNTAGTISYGEGSFATTVLGSGTFAQIHFLAKALVSGTDVNYVITGTGGVEDTYVNGIFGTDILGDTTGASVNIIPEPGSILLLGTGLCGLFGFGFIRKRRV